MRASLYRIQYNLTVLFCFIIAGTFAQSKQHFPRNHYVSGTSQIDFYWDTEVGADSYELQIAADQIFSINLRSYSGLTNDSQTVNLNQDSVYYWRMRSVTSGIPGAWSETRKLTIINPNSFGTLSLWLNPESNVAISSGKVTQWDDNTSNANHALQSNTNFQPTFVDSIKEINNHGAIRMDGTNDFLEFNALSGIRSVLVVINKDQPEGPSDIRPFLGHDSQFDFYRANEFLWTGSTHSNVKNGLSRINKTVIPNPGNTTVLPVGYNLISINTLGPTDAQNISRDFTISNRVWSGDYVEVMLYESLLSDSLLQLTEDYLIDKYTAHLDLPRVVNVDYGFCETDLEVAEGFVSYSWFKDGQNLNIDSNIIAVNAPGLYRVEATSVFGVTYADSVQVSYPVPISGLSDTTFCQYDSVGFASNVSTSIYSLSWSNGSVDSAIYIKQATDLSVTFTDTNGCKFESDTITLDMDSFPSSIDLGNDTNLCKGNIITLISGAFQSVSYLWSTGSTNTSISIDSTKYYSVTVSNVSGCVGVDSIFITIKGDAPIVDFSVDSSCFSDSILFTNLSTSTIGIDSIFWSFGDGGSDTNMNPKHLYSDSGLYNVSLYVETDSGCSASNNKPFRVFGNPVVSFSISSNIGCTGLNYQFTSAIQTFYNDTINSYVWDFGDGNGSSQNSPSHNYSSSNTYQVTLLATSIYGCSYSDTVLFEVNDTYPQPLNFNLVSPMNGSSVVGDSVQFNWNTSQEAFSYIIQVASDPLFGNVLITQNVSTTSAELAVLNANASNYWRVIALTPCLDSTFSEVFEFNHVEMSQLGMELWLHPEAGIDTSSGPVALWQDMSFSQHDAVQPSVGVMPNFIQNNFEINDHSSIQFDGVDDYLDFGSIDSIRTVFIVAKEDLYANAPAPRSLLAHPSAFDFYRNDSTFYGSAANNLIENGTTKLNKNTIDGRTTVVPSEYFIYSCQSLGNVRAQNLSWDNLVPGRVWSGEYVEVMIFDSALSDSTVELINDYLRFKYVKPVNIGNDIDIPYGFCDTTISVEGHYKSYQWFFDDVALVGATQNQISASNSGEYKVVVTDIFGFTHSDSLLVLFPGNFSDFIDTTICLDDTIVVSAQVGNGYTFNWSNGNTAESSSLFVNDTVSVMISDTLGCSFQSDSFVVSLDSFKTFVILASDTQICSGNSIGIESGASLISDYLWSNGDTTEKTDISTSNLYFLTATNSRGCAFVDTIDVTINGTAPVTGFTFQSVCQGDSTIFIDTSYTVDNSNIVQWSWAFGDGDSSILDNPKHLYLDTGLYTVTLNTLTDSGCSNENSGIIQINPNPMADFSTTSNVQCLGTHTVFLNQSVSQGSIDSLSWDFGVSGSSTDTSSITNPNYLYGAIGQYPVTLVAYSTNGCVDTLIKTIEIHDIPAPDFLFSNSCKGEDISFFDNSIGIVTQWSWNFGDGGTSNLTNPLHNYSDSGLFDVTLSLVNIFGCSADTTKTLRVYSIPEADFSFGLPCTNMPIDFLSTSVSHDDTIISHSWTISDGFNAVASSSDQSPSFMLNEAQDYFVELMIETSKGCQNTFSDNITVNQSPSSSFDFSPKYGAPPLVVNFEQSTTGAATYQWSFGNGDSSFVSEPSYTFMDSGSYKIILWAISDSGCTDSVSKTIDVRTPFIDLSINEISLIQSEDKDYFEIVVLLENKGSTDIEQFSIKLSEEYQNAIWDEWNDGILKPGDMLFYTFSTKIEVRDEKLPDFVCLEISEVNLAMDNIINNNDICWNNIDASPSLFRIYPIPVRDEMSIDLISPNNQNAHVKIFDEFGRTVLFELVTLVEGLNKFTINTDPLHSGVYFIQYISEQEETRTQKVIIERIGK